MVQYEYHDVNRRGTIKRVDYITHDWNGNPIEKYVNIYLPYRHDETNKYNILYLMHGGGGNPDAWLDTCMVKNMLDYMIDQKQIQPLIIAFPSYYKIPRETVKPDTDNERMQSQFYQEELIDETLPAVEAACSTYAEELTKDGFRKSRMHRGFGGFSMGSCTTWFAFEKNIDYFAWFLPFSGDCWEVECLGGKNSPEKTAEALHRYASESGYTPEEYFIYSATGSEDPAADGLGPQIEAMKKYTDTFVFDEDYAKGNLHYHLQEGFRHEYPAVCQYVYQILPYLFR